MQQPHHLFSPEALAALAALVPGSSLAAQPLTSQTPQLVAPEHAKQRKAGRGDDDTSAAGLPRPPTIKHEVYEDLEEKFEKLQGEREHKRHRGNPKGHQIRSFCKNPACGKQLNGGRTNKCEHCGYDLATHRRNAQLEKLIKSGPLAHTQVRATLRDAANEAHVRTGGKAMVLTLVYIEGAAQAPAQAIAYGKPAAAFVEARKELISSFEAACREHFQEQQAPGGQGQQQQQLEAQGQGQLLTLSGAAPGAAAGPGAPLLPLLQLATNATAQGPTPVSGGPLGAPRACPLGPTSQLLSSVGLGAGGTAACPSHGQVPTPVGATGAIYPLSSPAIAGTLPVDLDSVIASTLADPPAAIARCREARVSGEVLSRLPQAMQLTVLMQAGLLPGDAASVVVELEARLRLAQLPALSLAALAQQAVQQHTQPAQALPAPQPLQEQPQPPQHLLAVLAQPAGAQQALSAPLHAAHAPAASMQPAPHHPHYHHQQQQVPPVAGATGDTVIAHPEIVTGGASAYTAFTHAAAAAAGSAGVALPLTSEALHRSLGPLQAAIAAAAAAAAAGAGADGSGVPPLTGFVAGGPGALSLQGLVPGVQAGIQAGGLGPELGALGQGE